VRGNLAEFGPALVLFFVFMIVPMLVLIRFGIASGALYFIVAQAADSAARAPNYASAQKNVSTVISRLVDSPLGRLSGLTLSSISGTGLNIDECIVATGQKNIFGFARPLRKAINPAVNIYEYEVRASYTFEPLLSLHGVPCISEVPILGKQAILTASAVRAVEYPDGLVTDR